MDKFNFYFKRRVTEADLDTTLSDIETAIETPISQLYGAGFLPTPTVVEKATPNLSVNVGALLGYNKLGQRVQSTSSLNLSLSKDGQTIAGTAGTAGGTTITVPTAGNERWLMITVYFDQLFQDPQTDGNNVSVFFRTLDSFHFKITSGTIVTAPAAIGDKPTAPTDNGILLCDIRLRSTGIILNADVDFTRRQNIISTANMQTEILDARDSAFRSIVYSTIDARLEALESDYAKKDLANTFTLTNTFSSNLIVTGNITQTNGITTLSNNSTSSAFTLTQLGTGDIINVLDNTTEVFTILNGGKLGLTEASPTTPLHITSISTLTGTNKDVWTKLDNIVLTNVGWSGSGVGLSTNNVNFVRIGMRGTRSASVDTLNYFYINTVDPNGSSPFGTAKFVIDNLSRVGIGLTAPNEQLEVGVSTGGRVIISDAAGATRKGILFEGPGPSHPTSGRIDVFNYGSSSGLDLNLVSSGGKVGIRTGTPEGTLHVLSASAGALTVSSSHDDLIIENGANTGISVLAPDTSFSGLGFFSPGHGSASEASGLRWKQSTTELELYTNHTLGFLSFHTDALVERMRITSAGDVGIGITVPENKLHVAGDTTLDGIVYLGNKVGSVGLKVLPSRGTFNTSDPDPCLYTSINGPDFPIVASSQLVLQGRSSADVPIHFVTGTTPSIKMSISGNSGIGIGTSLPLDALHIKGTQRIDALIAPIAPTVAIQGAAGTTPYSYKIVAISVTGGTIPSPAGTTAVGNAILSVTNFNRITWSTVEGAYSYQVYGRTSGSELLLVTLRAISAPTYDDIGAATPVGALPTSNTTGRLVIGPAVNSTDSFSISKRPNGSGLAFSIDSLTRSPIEDVFKLASDNATNDFIITAGGHLKISTASNFNTVNIGGTGLRTHGDLPLTDTTSLDLQLGLLSGSISNNTSCYVATHNAGGPGTSAGDLLLIPRTSTATPGSIRLFTGATTPIERLTISSTGTVSVGTAFTVDSTGSIISSKSGTTVAAAHLFNHSTKTISLRLGTGTTTSLLTDEYSSAIRFNGSSVLWGDLAYYPNGGDAGEQGHFRISRGSSSVNTIPNAKLGVGSLYSAGAVGIGTTTTQGLLHVFRGESGSGIPNTSADDVIIENSSNCGLSILTADASISSIAFGSPLNTLGARTRWIPTTKTLEIGSNVTGGITRLNGGISSSGLVIDANSDTSITNNFKVNKTETLTKGTNIASAATLVLGDGNYFDVTGTTAITSITSKGVGTFITLQFDSSVNIVHNPITLVLPNGFNVTASSGDHFEFFEYGAGNWRLISSPVSSNPNRGYLWNLTNNSSGAISASSQNFTGIAYGNGVFVAVNSNTTDTIFRSINNGRSWILVTSPPTGSNFLAVTFGNGTFVAVGPSNNNIYYSTDLGVTWTAVLVNIGGSNFVNVKFIGGIFLAVSGPLVVASNIIATSSDGQSWTVRTTPNTSCQALVYDGTTHYALGISSSISIKSINGGVTWSSVGLAVTYVNAIYDGSLIVAINNTQVHTTTDAITWTNIGNAGLVLNRSIAHHNGVYIIVGNTTINTQAIKRFFDATGNIATSQRFSPIVSPLFDGFDVIFNDSGIAAAVGSNSANTLMVSF